MAVPAMPTLKDGLTCRMRENITSTTATPVTSTLARTSSTMPTTARPTSTTYCGPSITVRGGTVVPCAGR